MNVCLDASNHADLESTHPRNSETPASQAAAAVAVSSDLSWAAIRAGTVTQIWSIVMNRHVRTIDDHVLTIGNDGIPELTLSVATTALRASPSAVGPFVLRGAMGLSRCSVAAFDSIYGTACVLVGPGRERPVVQWIPGRWVVALSREDDRSWLCLQRLNRPERHPVLVPAATGKVSPAPPDGLDFSVEWVDSVDGEHVPVSRFHDPAARNRRSLVTVHGGFGISLRPMSGVPTDATFGDLVYAHVRGGGELGRQWAAAGRGALKRNALDDLRAVLNRESEAHEVALMGMSHGGWLALLAALRDPTSVDRVCVTSPITHLRDYLGSPLGQKHRAEFPDDEDLDDYDPALAITRRSSGRLPALLMVCGAADMTVANQRPEEFAVLWREAGGSCEVVRHSGGHYTPPAQEIDRVEQAQVDFLGLLG